jgi:ribose transport system permease protein
LAAIGQTRPMTTKQPDIGRTVAKFAAQYGILIVFCLMLAIFMATNPDFRRPANLMNILQQSSLIGVVSCGMVLVIIAGGFDLSVGAIGAGASITSATIMVSTGSIAMGITGGLAVGLLFGLFNGLLISVAKITPFVATLGSGTIMSGLIFAFTNARPVSGIPDVYTDWGLGKIAGIPTSAIAFLIVAFFAAAFTKVTRIGHYLYAVGSSPEASKLAGVPVSWTVIVGYALCGLCAGLAGLMLLGQTGIGQPTAGTNWALLAIAAVVVGGTPLRGGTGGVQSAVIGTLLLGVLANALNLYGVSPYWQPAVTGVVILLAVGAENLQQKL